MIIGPVVVIYSSFTTRMSVFSQFGFFGAGYCNRTSWSCLFGVVCAQDLKSAWICMNDAQEINKKLHFSFLYKCVAYSEY